MAGSVGKIFRRAAGPFLLSVTFSVLAAVTWRKWPDLWVDFGRELYVPWQLAQGKILYRDLALHYGPLAEYVNAGLFKLFGVSIRTLIFGNLAILAGIVSLIYALLARCCDRLTAFAAGMILLLVFAFPQYSAIGSMNLVAPYSHAATHGLAWSVAMIFCLGRWRKTTRLFFPALAGACLGCVFLTKPEFFFAAAAAALAWAGSLRLGPESETGSSAQALAVFALAALVAPLLFLLYFAVPLSLTEAAQAVTRSWSYALRPGLSKNYYFQAGMGLDDLHANLRLMLKMFGYLAAWLGLASVADWAGRLSKANPRWLSPLLGLVGAAGFWRASDLIPWFELPRALLLTTLLAGAALGWKAFHHRQDPALASRYATLTVWAVWALALLPKMIFNVRFSHYGFCLAMPAMLLLVVALVWLWPQWLGRRGAGGQCFRALALAALAVAAWNYWQVSQRYYGFKNLPVGKGGDLISGYSREIHPRDFFFGQALHWIERETPASATLAAFPEGTMLNYLSRRPNPTPYVYFTKVEMISFGEDRMLAAMQAAPPDYLVLEHLSSEDYGVGYFGEDPAYGRSIMDWARGHYHQVVQIGPEPFSEDLFFIQIFERKK